MENPSNKDGKLTPFVKWAGGKRQLLPELKRFSPKNFGKYIEPFLGGGIVYLTLRPNQAVLGDSNQNLIECYTVVREYVDELINVRCPQLRDPSIVQALHDRYIISENIAFNVLPVGSLIRGQQGSLHLEENPPDFQDLWARGRTL